MQITADLYNVARQSSFVLSNHIILCCRKSNIIAHFQRWVHRGWKRRFVKQMIALMQVHLEQG